MKNLQDLRLTLLVTRMLGEGCIVNNSGHSFYYKSGDTREGGVGCIVNKNIAGNSRQSSPTHCKNHQYKINIINVYLSVSSHADEEVGTVYEDIGGLLANSKAQYNLINGAFNTNIGKNNFEDGKPCTWIRR